MADDETSDVEDQPDPTESGGGGKGLIIAFVAIIVLAETGMFFFLVPSAEEVSMLAAEKLVESVQQGQEDANEQESDENEISEFNLGLYGETFSPIDTERNYRVEIDLYGLIKMKDIEKIKDEYGKKSGRIRHAIRMKIRNSALEELNENKLGLLERRILTTCNHWLEGDLLLGIGFKSYQLLEQ
jgi:flagellar basal body-associated protein FliL